jgi:hypothetical protein
MAASKITQSTIHCDGCGHEFPGVAPDWHNKTCPKCGGGVLITDADLAIWQGVQALVDLLNALFPDTTDADMTNVHFDTAPLRDLQS